MSTWDKIYKRWVISIDFGFTEPCALKKLLCMPNTEVRIPYAAQVLQKKLQPATCFHAKSLILFNKGYEKGPTGIVVGSANMTLNGFSYGHEHAMSMAWKKGPKKIATDFKAKINEFARIEEVYRNATLLDNDLLSAYVKARKNLQVTQVDNIPQLVEGFLTESDKHDFNITLPEAIFLAAAKNYWIQGGYIVKNRGPLLPGNQIDLPRGTSLYFGFPVRQQDRNTPIGEIKIDFGGTKGEYNLRFGNNFMEKLNLPVPGEKGPTTYEGQTLLLSKKSDGVFKLDVCSSDSSKAILWQGKSKKQHTLFAMRSGREFGVFD